MEHSETKEGAGRSAALERLGRPPSTAPSGEPPPGPPGATSPGKEDEVVDARHEAGSDGLDGLSARELKQRAAAAVGHVDELLKLPVDRADLIARIRRAEAEAEEAAAAAAASVPGAPDLRSAEWWSHGVPEARTSQTWKRNATRNARIAEAVDLREWPLHRLLQLARARSCRVPRGSTCREDVLEAIREGSGRARKSVAAQRLLGGWLAAHDNFRAFAQALGPKATAVADDVDAGRVALGAAEDRAWRVSRDLLRLNGALHGHGGWEERTIFAFLLSEFPSSFEPFHTRLVAEHGDCHELTDEIQSHIGVWCSAPDSGTRRLRRAAQLLDEWSDDLHRHLEAEEDAVVPLVLSLNAEQRGRLDDVLDGGRSRRGQRRPAKRGGAGGYSCCGRNEYGGCCV